MKYLLPLSALRNQQSAVNNYQYFKKNIRQKADCKKPKAIK